MLEINKAVLKPWSPCSEGYQWFIKRFPQGADYAVVQKALRDDKRFDDARWLTNAVWENLILETPSLSADVAADHTAEAAELIASTELEIKVKPVDSHQTSDNGVAESKLSASGNYTQIGASGYYTRIGASGDSTRIGASGNYTQIGASGNYTRIGASGYCTRIGASGDSTQIGASGDSTRIGASGYCTRIGASGKDAVIACAGLHTTAKAAENGVLALAWYDEATKRTRIAVGYVGEDLKANTWYEVQNGAFVETGV